MELEVTWKRAVKVWWAYVWRNLLALVAAVVIGAIVGGIIGLIMGILGASTETVRIITMPVGFVIGIAVSIVPIKLILGKDFGEFRLILVQKDTDTLK